MECPRGCEGRLLLADRQGIEIDYCPECRGIWLDRGELEKILSRSYSQEAATAMLRSPYDNRSDSYARHDPDKRRKRGFLSEIFDFD